MGFKSAIVAMFFLDSVIGEVPIDVVRVSCVLPTTGSEITLLIPVGSQFASHARYK